MQLAIVYKMLVVFYYTATLVAVVASYKAAVVEFRIDRNNLSHQYVQNNLIGFENEDYG